jgi:hypothetical protein
VTTIHLQVEGEEIILLDVRNREPNCIAVLDAAAALDLAARLKEAALKVQAEDENAFTALHGH